MTAHGRVSTDEATRIGQLIGIDWASARFDVEEFRAGMEVELEHGARDPATGGGDATFAALLDFRLEPRRRRSITQRTLAEHPTPARLRRSARGSVRLSAPRRPAHEPR